MLHLTRSALGRVGPLLADEPHTLDAADDLMCTSNLQVNEGLLDMFSQLIFSPRQLLLQDQPVWLCFFFFSFFFLSPVFPVTGMAPSQKFACGCPSK